MLHKSKQINIMVLSGLINYEFINGESRKQLDDSTKMEENETREGVRKAKRPERYFNDFKN